ncbi:MAG: NAD(P)H-hydrate dehydratase [Chloroflexi bacterium]|nr:NAD(P)H-hydrate dehydratase [Chloroflexota bacterium]
MPKIVTVKQMRAIEKATDAAGHTYADMMQLAGRAVTERAKDHLRGVADPRVVVLVGPGNNGGDGLVVARLLLEEVNDCAVGALLLAPRDADDDVFAAAQEAGVVLIDAEADRTDDFAQLFDWVMGADVIIDALFGTSLRLPLEGDAVDVLESVHRALAHRRAEDLPPAYTTPANPEPIIRADDPVIIAVDCPSGLDCDTGEVDELALTAHETVTFAAAKPGLLTFPGANYVGHLHLGDIGLPVPLPELDKIALTLVDAAESGARLPQRPLDSHKGTFGKAMVVAGSLNYTGAAYLAAAGAYRVGAGLVTGASPQIIVPMLAGMLPEATWLLLPHDMGVINEAAVRVLREEIADYDAMLLGPGFGREDVTGEFLRELLVPQEQERRSRAIGFVQDAPTNAEVEAAHAELPPLVIDADALNLLAGMDDWARLVPPGTILTPHPGEFARLANIDTADVAADRLALAIDKAAEWDCVVVLKGAFTVIAAPDGFAAVLPFASPALASAGTGDVLAGAIVGLLAQGLAPFDAALVGGWLHGMAGVRAAELIGTAASVMAGDVLEMLPEALAQAENARG